MKQRIKSLLRNNVPSPIYNTFRDISRGFSADNLTELATYHKTDKWGLHWYASHYEQHFRQLRKMNLNILEIGVGGYDDPTRGGASLRMWKDYFPNGLVYSIDKYDKSNLQEQRIKIFQGSQNDPDFLRWVVQQIGRVDIIIDDGSHINEHVITSFRTLFPLLADKGVYAIEDIQTSYWPSFGGDSYDLNRADTIMGFLKGLLDSLNYEEIAKRNYEPSYFDLNTVSLHFYHNLALIYKGKNAEGSNLAHENIY